VGRLWSDGYETGSASERATNSGTVAIVTDVVRSGTYAGQANPTAGTGFWRQIVYASDQATVCYARAYLRISAYPDVTTDILIPQNSNPTRLSRIRLTAAGTLQLANSSGTQVGSSSGVLSLNTWYRVEIKHDATSSSGALEARLDGTVFASGANNVQGQWSRVAWGPADTCTTDLRFDDIAINDGAGTAQNGYPGAGSIRHLRPSRRGDTSSWSRSGSGSANWDSIAEVPPDDSTSYIRSNVAAAVDESATGPSGLSVNDTITLVAVGARYAGNTASPFSGFVVRLKAAPGGTVSEGPEILPASTSWLTNANADPKLPPITAYTLPGTSTAWTAAQLNQAQVGVRVSTSDTNEARVSGLWLLVEYVPGSPVAPPAGTMLALFD